MALPIIDYWYSMFLDAASPAIFVSLDMVEMCRLGFGMAVPGRMELRMAIGTSLHGIMSAHLFCTPHSYGLAQKSFQATSNYPSFIMTIIGCLHMTHAFHVFYLNHIFF